LFDDDDADGDGDEGKMQEESENVIHRVRFLLFFRAVPYRTVEQPLSGRALYFVLFLSLSLSAD
jgi:hypothetical protein